MCYHGGDLPNSRHKEAVRMSVCNVWVGVGASSTTAGGGTKITPSGYQLPKRGSASGIILHHQNPLKKMGSQII